MHIPPVMSVSTTDAGLMLLPVYRPGLVVWGEHDPDKNALRRNDYLGMYFEKSRTILKFFLMMMVPLKCSIRGTRGLKQSGHEESEDILHVNIAPNFHPDLG
jgi:hypothetical protein